MFAPRRHSARAARRWSWLHLPIAQRDPDALEHLLAPRPVRRLGGQLLGDGDVVADRQVADEVDHLVDEADALGAQAGPEFLRAPREALAADTDLAAVGLVEPGEHAE